MDLELLKFLSEYGVMFIISAVFIVNSKKMFQTFLEEKKEDLMYRKVANESIEKLTNTLCDLKELLGGFKDLTESFEIYQLEITERLESIEQELLNSEEINKKEFKKLYMEIQELKQLIEKRK